MSKLEIPPRCLLEDARKKVKDYLADYAIEHRDGVSGETRYYCKHCQRLLNAIGTQVSKHDARWGDDCKGWGETIMVALPYCTNCDELPTIGGCIHV